ncbi:DUF2946 family protein [Motiliproteus sp. MSK22-1]|uniref:DUF2946 family protein n=1 Tax=Motiliproteus sp. MSK22-1 TaxID=1897630 RepID=UPI0009785727|nr:DUF2946 family protein [Motiliproteus sp. MSK22-1]OMH31746.1 hypothetical protein BGP75_16625 [Motiliproteus sp. MSK22-1]
MTLSNHAKQALTLVLLLVLVQAGLPLLTAPIQKTDSNGKTVWVCTLQGLQQILIDSSEQQDTDSKQNSFQCPVCSLGQAFASAIPPDTDLAALEKGSSAPFPPNPRSAQPYHRVSSVRVRAPPFS